MEQVIWEFLEKHTTYVDEVVPGRFLWSCSCGRVGSTARPTEDSALKHHARHVRTEARHLAKWYRENVQAFRDVSSWHRLLRIRLDPRDRVFPTHVWECACGKEGGQHSRRGLSEKMAKSHHQTHTRQATYSFIDELATLLEDFEIKRPPTPTVQPTPRERGSDGKYIKTTH